MVCEAGNLPNEVTSFIGRRHFTADVRALLAATRLVTLTGPGGVGKSRLAVHIARTLRRASPGGAWLVELGELRDPALLGHLVAATLGITDHSARSPEEALVSHLGDRRLLLVLDNCEHLLDACASLVANLLRSTSGVQIIATSREPLGVRGEHVYPVAPFPVTDLQRDWAGEPDDRTENSEALELFQQRAAAALPDFRIDASNRATVAELCARLDGIPLAIELAAVRLRALSPQRILQRLSDDLDVLSPGMRGATPRHQTLRTAVGWSHALCSPREQLIWARLSVFPGAFDLDAAVAVCRDDDHSADVVVDTVASLVEKSLLIHDHRSSPERYRLLETLRQYGREQLLEHGDEHRLRQRHRDHFADLVARAEAGWAGAEQAQWSAVIRREQANLRAALDFCFSHDGEESTGLQMAAALWFTWVSGAEREGRLWLERGRETVTTSPHLAKALWVGGWAAQTQGEIETAKELLVQARRLATEAGDEENFACATQQAAACALVEGDLDQASALLEEALEHHRSVGTWSAVALLSLVVRAWVSVVRGDVGSALDLSAECRRLGAARGEHWGVSWAHWMTGFAGWASGDAALARTHLRQCIRMKQDLHDWLGIAWAIEVLAWVDLKDGHVERSARLLGAGGRLWQPIGRPLFGFDIYTDQHERSRDELRVALGAPAFERALRAGAALAPADAVALALDEARTKADPPSRKDSPLTRREREVAGLVAAGLSNSDIARTLVIAQRTAETHVQNILVKLGLTSRAQVATWSAAHPSPQA